MLAHGGVEVSRKRVPAAAATPCPARGDAVPCRAMDVTPAYTLTFAAATTCGLLGLLHAGQQVLAPGRTVAADLRRENLARSLLHVGQVLGAFFIATAVTASSVTGASVGRDILWVAVYGVVGLVVMSISGHLGTKVLLQSAIHAEIARGNVAAGLAAGAHYAATGLLTSKAIAGTDLRGLGLSLVFFLIAQATLHLLVILFRTLTSYDDAAQIRSENLAAAVSYAGITLGVGILVGHAVEGDFEGWTVSLVGYGKALLGGFAFWPVRQVVVQGLLLGLGFAPFKGGLDRAIGERRNVGAAALEAVAYIATALAVVRLS
jgi:uncharacterized membrane protein YjfL (UPF0719 family)